MNRALALLCCLASALFLNACISTGARGEVPGTIHHAVFIKLTDPAQAPELLADSRELARISGVIGFTVGQRFESGRPTVLSDFDVAVFLSFENDAEYKAYLEHPVHQQLLAKWRPRFQTLQIRDFDGRHEVPTAQ